jgi:hypothetical protein
VFVVVGVTVKTSELEVAADEIVPFKAIPDPVGVPVGEEGLVVMTVSLVVGVVMSVADIVGELVGVAVVLKDWVTTMVADALDDVPGPVKPDPGLVVEVLAADGGVVVTSVVEAVVVAALGGVEVDPRVGTIGEMMLERRLAKSVELVVAAPEGLGLGVGSGVGVTAGVVTPVEAAPVTPVEGSRVGVGLGVGVERRALVNDSITPERGSVPGDEVAAGEGEEGETAGLDVEAAGEGVGVGVAGSSKLDTRPLTVGNSPDGLGVGELEVDAAAALAVDPPVPEKDTPSVEALLSLEVEELVVVPPVIIPPGPKVIPLPAAEDGDGTLTVVGEALSGAAAGLEGVG